MTEPAPRGEFPPGDPMRDEARLVAALRAGEPALTSEFLLRTHHPVYCLACRVSRDEDERRDWSHDALLGVLDDVRRGRFELRHPGGFWSWFRKRAYFRLLDQRRRALRSRTREQPVEPPELADYGVEADPGEELERVELAGAVEDCLGRLANDDHRRALALLLDHELPYVDIAGAMQAPLASVKVWILRARRALRRCLAERWGLRGREDAGAGGEEA